MDAGGAHFRMRLVEPIAALGRPSLKDICDSARQTFLGAIDTVKSSMTSN